MPELHRPADFAAVLSDPVQPLIVGGQAVNIWAEVYLPTDPSLREFEPFTSKDADIHGDRELAETYLLEMHSAIGRPDMTERNFLGAIAYVTEVIRSANACTVTQRHDLDFTVIFPTSLAQSPHEKVRRFAEHQLPRLLARRSAAK